MSTTNPTLPVIDWDQKGRFSNNAEQLHKDLLVMFAKELPDFQKDIDQAFRQSNWKVLGERLHKLQGGCAYCGLPRLKAAAAELANIVRSGKTPDQKLLQQVITEITAVMNELQKKNIISLH